MKKSFIVLLSMLAATIVAAMLFYYIRKNQSVKQYVHTRSASIFSIAIDDLALQRIDQLFKPAASDSNKVEQIKSKLWTNLWSAGVHIPAHVFLFNLPEDSNTFYSIQKISDPVKWQKFLSKYAKEQVTDENKHDTQQLFQLGKFVSIYHDEKHIIIRVRATKENRETAFPKSVTDPKQWSQIIDSKSFSSDILDHHFAYWTSDQHISLHADITNRQTSIGGFWKVKHANSGSNKVRNFDKQDAAFAFWSNLPLREMPFLTKFVEQFTENRMTPQSEIDYLDIIARKQLTAQEDTIISYDYDENFNSVEKQEIQRVQVPIIESAWKGDSTITKQLPNKIFYTFYTVQRDSLSILSTKFPEKVATTFSPTDRVFEVQLNFVNWPDAWLLGALKAAKQHEVKGSLHATAAEDNVLHIQGEINYRDLPF